MYLKVWYLEPTLIEWLNVGGVLRLLHAQIASGRTKGTVYVDHVLVILVASVAMRRETGKVSREQVK